MSRSVEIIFQGKNNVSRVAGQVEGSLRSMRAEAGLLIKSLAGVAAGFAVFQVGRGIVSVTSQMENLEVSFATMLGTSDKAKKMLADLNKFAAVTPFETTELAEATKKLLAFGITQDKIIPTMRRLGDIASGLGIPLGELSKIYGKARVQGRLFAEDVNQLTGRGIPVIQEFAKQFGVADSEVRKLVETGRIGFPQLEKAIQGLTDSGGMFAGGMANLSKTLSGQWSGLSDTIKMIGVNLGNDMLPMLKLLVAEAGILAEHFGAIYGSGEAAAVKKRTARISELEDLIREEKGNGFAVNVRRGDGQPSPLAGYRAELAELRKQDEAEFQRKLSDDRKVRAEQNGKDQVAAFSDFIAKQLATGGNALGGRSAELRKAMGAMVADAILASQGRIKQDEFNKSQLRVPFFDAFFNEKDKDKAKVKRDPMDTFAATESRFLTRGAGAINPMVAEQQKANRLHEKEVKILNEQKAELQKIANKRGLQPANFGR